MIRLGLISFTEKGGQLKDRLMDLAPGWSFRGEQMEAVAYGPKEHERAFTECRVVVFIGACGIAVRYIAPLLTDKLHDPAVIVIDEGGRFVIPILSGHVGGANAVSRMIADDIGAEAAVTTATDVEGVFAVDEFAAGNGLKISEREKIRPIARMLLTGKPVNMAVADDVIISSDASDIDKCILHLMVRPYVVGMGCRKDKDPSELEAYFMETLERLDIRTGHVCALASIDIKKDEPALTMLAKKLDIPFMTYTADELQSVEGDFAHSDFVEKTVGVSDVSARAAKACGRSGHFLLKKDSRDGMTVSVFEKYRRITFDYG